jgi:hypothetical protein
MLKVPALLEEQKTRDAILAGLEVLAAKQARSSPPGALSESDLGLAEVLNDAATAVAAMGTDARQRAQLLGAALLRFSSLWPKLLRIAHPYLEFVARHAPVNQSATLTPILIAMRAI